MCGIRLILMFIISKSNAISLISQLRILVDVILGKYFLVLNTNSNDFGSNFSKHFRPDENVRALSAVHIIICAFFPTFEYFASAGVNFLGRSLACDMSSATACSLASVVSVTSFFGSDILFLFFFFFFFFFFVTAIFNISKV